ncbi:hypothetical protein MPSEU_000143400 [Mayamaea pseudoterrestris]|nr:hypothetical protein MPSEU_000143400 [Mayamaea pseudoterrestris]
MNLLCCSAAVFVVAVTQVYSLGCGVSSCDLHHDLKKAFSADDIHPFAWQRERIQQHQRKCKTSLQATMTECLNSVDEPILPKKKRTKVDPSQPLHWNVDTDEFLLAYTHNATDNSRFLSKIRFDIRGNPLPLRRHRSSRGFMYNPSAAAQESFRTTVQHVVSAATNDPAQYVNDSSYPLFAAHHMLRMTMIFYLKRPKHHFTANRPGYGRLKENAPHALLSLTKKDVDNLAKFVMDSLNGMAYADDHQIGSLHVTKLLDDSDECLGRTRVQIEVLQKADMEGLL